MYRCARCNTVTPRNQPAISVIRDVRIRRYPAPPPPPGRGRRKGPAPQRTDGEGWEIVGEDMVCASCQTEAEAYLTQRMTELGISSAEL